MNFRGSICHPYGSKPDLYVGDCLISSGDDGTVRFWKKSLSGEWMEFAETNMAYQ